MSRIGNRKLTIPQNVDVNIDGNNITVKSSKGELSLTFSNLLDVKVDDGCIVVSKKVDNKEANILSGTTNANINNMLIGVSEGFTKELQAVGVGYRFQVSGNKIIINAGYSNPVEVLIPSTLTATSSANDSLKISGINKQEVSEFAANIRKIREPEPYKGKGIRYVDEHVRRKEGKKAAK